MNECMEKKNTCLLLIYCHWNLHYISSYLSAWEAEATACPIVFYGVNLIMMIKLKAAELLTS